MERILKAIVGITLIFLAVTVALGCINVYLDYVEYGWTYEITVLIGGESAVQTVSLTNNVIALGFMSWIIILFYILVARIINMEHFFREHQWIKIEEEAPEMVEHGKTD